MLWGSELGINVHLPLRVCWPAREPRTGKSPKVLPECSRDCSQKSGCSRECSRECSRGCFSLCVNLPSPSLSVQNGSRITTTFTCGWVGSKGSSYQLNFSERQIPTFFSRPFFLLCPVHPTLPQAIFFPKIPYFWDRRSTLSSREGTCRGWVLGTVLDGVAPQEKRKILFFLLAREKGENCDYITFTFACSIPQDFKW